MRSPEPPCSGRVPRRPRGCCSESPHSAAPKQASPQVASEPGGDKKQPCSCRSSRSIAAWASLNCPHAEPPLHEGQARPLLLGAPGGAALQPASPEGPQTPGVCSRGHGGSTQQRRDCIGASAQDTAQWSACCARGPEDRDDRQSWAAAPRKATRGAALRGPETPQTGGPVTWLSQDGAARSPGTFTEMGGGVCCHSDGRSCHAPPPPPVPQDPPPTSALEREHRMLWFPTHSVFRELSRLQDPPGWCSLPCHPQYDATRDRGSHPPASQCAPAKQRQTVCANPPVLQCRHVRVTPDWNTQSTKSISTLSETLQDVL